MHGDQARADVADGSVGEGEVDGEVELIPLEQRLVGPVAGQVDRGVVQELVRGVLAGGDQPVPVGRAGVGPVLERAGGEPAGHRVGQLPQVADQGHGGVDLLRGLAGEAKDEVPLRLSAC